MSKTLYLEGATGISGDMTVAALLSLGASEDKLHEVLHSLPLSGYTYSISKGDSHGIAGLRFKVHVDGEHPHSHGHNHEIESVHTHDHEHGHHHHEHGHHHHEHRGLADIIPLIEGSAMSSRAKQIAVSCFRIIALAEAKAHGCDINEVHFHEVGAVDSIVDIVAVAVLVDDLGIGECIVTELTEGCGTVRCAHGVLPVPVPAVVNIAEISGITLRPCSARGEMITPTGIALAACLRTRDSLPESYRIEKVGIGLGQRDFGRPNCLRAMILQDKSPARSAEQIMVLECNIDDSTGEELGFAMEQILAAGARDVHSIPCYMKKNRPAYLLRVICMAADVEALEQLIFSCTSTIGLRKYAVERSIMARELITVTLPEGEVLVKKCSFAGIIKYYPEYESLKKLCATINSPQRFRDLYQQASILAAQQDKPQS